MGRDNSLTTIQPQSSQQQAMAVFSDKFRHQTRPTIDADEVANDPAKTAFAILELVQEAEQLVIVDWLNQKKLHDNSVANSAIKNVLILLTSELQLKRAHGLKIMSEAVNQLILKALSGIMSKVLTEVYSNAALGIQMTEAQITRKVSNLIMQIYGPIVALMLPQDRAILLAGLPHQLQQLPFELVSDRLNPSKLSEMMGSLSDNSSRHLSTLEGLDYGFDLTDFKKAYQSYLEAYHQYSQKSHELIQRVNLTEGIEITDTMISDAYNSIFSDLQNPIDPIVVSVYASIVDARHQLRHRGVEKDFLWKDVYQQCEKLIGQLEAKIAQSSYNNTNQQFFYGGMFKYLYAQRAWHPWAASHIDVIIVRYKLKAVGNNLESDVRVDINQFASNAIPTGNCFTLEAWCQYADAELFGIRSALAASADVNARPLFALQHRAELPDDIQSGLEQMQDWSSSSSSASSDNANAVTSMLISLEGQTARVGATTVLVSTPAQQQQQADSKAVVTAQTELKQNVKDNRSFLAEVDKLNNLASAEALYEIGHSSVKLNNWSFLLKALREKALSLLKEKAPAFKENDLQKSAQERKAFLQLHRPKALFIKHRNFSALAGAWGRTRTASVIDDLIDECNVKLKLSLDARPRAAAMVIGAVVGFVVLAALAGTGVLPAFLGLSGALFVVSAGLLGATAGVALASVINLAWFGIEHAVKPKAQNSSHGKAYLVVGGAAVGTGLLATLAATSIFPAIAGLTGIALLGATAGIGLGAGLLVFGAAALIWHAIENRERSVDGSDYQPAPVTAESTGTGVNAGPALGSAVPASGPAVVRNTGSTVRTDGQRTQSYTVEELDDDDTDSAHRLD